MSDDESPASAGKRVVLEMTMTDTAPTGRDQAGTAGRSRLQIAIILLVAAIAVMLPFWIPMSNKAYVLTVLTGIAITATTGVSFNLLGGFAGQVSFGHAVFYGIGAYTFANLFSHAHLNYFVALLCGGLLAAILSLPMGLLLFRLRGPYFALSMLAFAEIVRIISNAWTGATGGASGFLLTTPYTERATLYWIVLGILVFSLLLSWLLTRGRAGAYFLAIREDEDVAEALGVHTLRYKLAAMAPSAFIMGLAGAFYAAYFAYLEPDVVFSSLDISLNVVVVTIVGGVATVTGPVVGALVLGIATQIFVNTSGGANALLSGVILVIFIILLPDGLVGGAKRLVRRLSHG